MLCILDLGVAACDGFIVWLGKGPSAKRLRSWGVPFGSKSKLISILDNLELSAVGFVLFHDPFNRSGNPTTAACSDWSA